MYIKLLNFLSFKQFEITLNSFKTKKNLVKQALNLKKYFQNIMLTFVLSVS